MKIRTINHLSDLLSAQLAWRKKELSDIKYLIETSGISETRKNVLLRSAITIIYAHWEGFIKAAGRYYLEYLASQREIKNSELKSNFLTISMISSCEIQSNSKKYSSFHGITDFFENKIDSRAKIPYKEIVDTESNLSSNVLREIVWCLGLDYSPYESKEKLINSKMLDKRNHIAHGEFLDIDKDDVFELRDTVLSLLDTFKNQIENSVIQKAYLKNATNNAYIP